MQEENLIFIMVRLGCVAHTQQNAPKHNQNEFKHFIFISDVDKILPWQDGRCIT